MRQGCVVLSLLTGLLCNGTADADPVKLSSGGLGVQLFGDATLGFQFVGPNVNLVGQSFNDEGENRLYLVTVRGPQPERLTPGQLVSISTDVQLLHSFATLNRGPLVDVKGSLHFRSRLAPLGCATPDEFGDFSCTVRAPFTFTGDLGLFDVESDHFLSRLRLVGQGIGSSAYFNGIHGNAVDSFGYTFSAVATPEPAAVFLFGSGMVLLWGHRAYMYLTSAIRRS